MALSPITDMSPQGEGQSLGSTENPWYSVVADNVSDGSRIASMESVIDSVLVKDHAVLTNRDAVNQHPQSAITGLQEKFLEINDALGEKADLVGGKVPVSQLPVDMVTQTFYINDSSELTSLTDANPGDYAHVIDGGAIVESYTLIADDPTDINNWKNADNAGSVTSVNGKQGVVEVDLVDFPGVQSALNEKVESSTLNTLLAEKAPINSPDFQGAPKVSGKLISDMAFVSYPANDGKTYGMKGDGTWDPFSGGGGGLDLGVFPHPDVTTWIQSTLPSGLQWTSVIYGKGRFVALATNGAIAYRNYGEDEWTLVLTLAIGPNYWQSVTYGKGRFVAVANNSRVAYSDDGIEWTAVSVSIGALSSVTYGNGLFVAVGTNGKAIYSNDGVTWQETSMPLSGWNSVTYGKGRFVAVGGYGRIAYSDDGIVWTLAQVLESESNLYSVTYGKGRFVAVGSSGRIAYSDDGIAWIEAMLVPGIWYSVTYGDGLFVAVGGNGKAIYSNDGVTWQETSMPALVSASWSSVAYGDGMFMAVSQGGDGSDVAAFTNVTYSPRKIIDTSGDEVITAAGFWRTKVIAAGGGGGKGGSVELGGIGGEAGGDTSFGDVTALGGGGGGGGGANHGGGGGGGAGEVKEDIVYLEAGQVVPVVIGAGGLGGATNPATSASPGGGIYGGKAGGRGQGAMGGGGMAPGTNADAGLVSFSCGNGGNGGFNGTQYGGGGGGGGAFYTGYAVGHPGSGSANGANATETAAGKGGDGAVILEFLGA